MKQFAFVFALFVAVCAMTIWACDPHGNNKPVCNDQLAGQAFRNFWDPTRFWLCPQNGTEPIVVQCDIETLYDEATGQCIHYSDWRWTFPCPQENVTGSA